MAWRPKNLSDALFPICILYAIIGYGIFQHPIGRQRVQFSQAYAIITGFLYYSVLTYNLLFVQIPLWSSTQDMVLNIVILANSGIAIMTQIISWYNAGVMKVDETLQILGANMNYCRTMNIGSLMIIYWLITLVCLNLSEAMNSKWNEDGYSLIVKIWVSMIINHTIHANAIFSLNFALALRILESRFYKLNELIEDSLNSYYQQPRVESWSFRRYRNSNVNHNLRNLSRRLWQADESFKSLIQTVKHVHLELMLTSKYLDKIYGLPMALETACFFISSTGLMYDLYKTIMDTEFPIREFEMVSAIAWIIVPFMNIMVINRSCESVRAEAKRTDSLIHGIDSTIGDSEFHDEIQQFSFQMMKNRVTFSPAGFYDLGYPFVITFVHSVMTYLVILIQSDRRT